MARMKKILDEETFSVELFDAENGTKLGQVTRTTVTIDNKRDNDGNFRNILKYIEVYSQF